MKYSFHPDARKEFNEAIEYYNECQHNLGLEFVNEIYNSIQLVLKFPNAWSPFSKSTRRCMINRFPYGLIYQQNEDEIYIVAVMQLNKEVTYWHERIKE